MRKAVLGSLFSGSDIARRALKIAAVSVGIAIVTCGAARAEDDEEQPDESFEQKIIGGLMKGLGNSTIDDNSQGINYRERSPLVVPSKLDLPPPAGKKAPMAANWPKDPDELARKAAIEESKKPVIDPLVAQRPLMPSELAAKKPRGKDSDDTTPGTDNSKSYILSPSALGYNGGLLGGMFGGNKEEATKFTKEPDRATLTQPPVGYQTPSPNYAYGTGPMKGTTNDPYNPITDKGGPERQ